MVDIENKELLKIMWFPIEEEVLFNIKNETFLPIASKLYNEVFGNFDITKWKELYGQAYDEWLNEDDSSIYDINSQVNQSMIKTLMNELMRMRHLTTFGKRPSIYQLIIF